MSLFQPKVSVVIFGYNRPTLVKDAIESVLKQTYRNIELVLVDNGSSDNTPDVMRAYAARHRHIKFLRNEKNERPTAVTIQGVAATTGEFVSILYDDDYYLPEKIEREVQAFSQLDSSYGVVYCSGYRLNTLTGEQWLAPTFRESGWVLRRMFERYAVDGMILPIAPLIRKECYLRYPYRPEILSEGDDIFFRFALSYRFFFLDEPLVVMRDHPSNMGKAIRVNAGNFLASMYRLLKEPELKKEDARALRRYVGRVFRNYGWQGFRVLQDKPWAWGSLKTSVKWDPRQAFHPRFLAALLVLLLPTPLFHGLTRLLKAVKRNREVVAARESYV